MYTPIEKHAPFFSFSFITNHRLSTTTKITIQNHNCCDVYKFPYVAPNQLTWVIFLIFQVTHTWVCKNVKIKRRRVFVWLLCANILRRFLLIIHLRWIDSTCEEIHIPFSFTFHLPHSWAMCVELLCSENTRLVFLKFALFILCSESSHHSTKWKMCKLI